jgi:glucoamylase
MKDGLTQIDLSHPTERNRALNDQHLYRWLEQQGEAFGAPGLEPRWTSSVKDAIGTAYSASSRVWFTCSHGILNEIYHPTIDSAQVRDMEFLVTDGETFAHEEKRDLLTTFEYFHPEALGVRYVNRDPDGRYGLTKEIICDPHHSVVLTNVRLEGHPELLPRLRVYALLAPHLDGGGAGNTARAVDIAGHKMLLGWKNRWSLAMGSSCGFARVSCGFVGASDGWRDVMEHFGMEWEFGSATGGNLALIGQINLEAAREDGAREFTVAIGIGEGHHTALQKTVSAMAMPFEQNRERFIEQWRRAANPEWLAAKAGDGGKLMRASHNVLLAHEDKTYSGAFVASMSIPWGQVHGDDDLGGYHLVWTRDMVQTATARPGLPCLHPAAQRWLCTELLGRRPSLLGRGAIRRGGVSAHPRLAPLEGRQPGRDGRRSIRRTRRGISGAPCAHYPSGTLGRECRIFTLHACYGDCRAHLRGRDCPRPRFNRAGRVS